MLIPGWDLKRGPQERDPTQLPLKVRSKGLAGAVDVVAPRQAGLHLQAKGRMLIIL